MFNIAPAAEARNGTGAPGGPRDEDCRAASRESQLAAALRGGNIRQMAEVGQICCEGCGQNRRPSLPGISERLLQCYVMNEA